MALSINANLCPQNHVCPMLSVCPVGAISQEGHALPTINADLCIECGQCAKICGKQAVYKVDGREASTESRS